MDGLRVFRKREIGKKQPLLIEPQRGQAENQRSPHKKHPVTDNSKALFGHLEADSCTETESYPNWEKSLKATRASPARASP